MTTTCILRLLTVCAVGYALWTVWYLFRESRRSSSRPPVSDAAPRRREIIGKSRFVLDRRRSLPQAAIGLLSNGRGYNPLPLLLDVINLLLNIEDRNNE